jgi:hypothetical protein
METPSGWFGELQLANAFAVGGSGATVATQARFPEEMLRGRFEQGRLRKHDDRASAELLCRSRSPLSCPMLLVPVASPLAPGAVRIAEHGARGLQPGHGDAER